MKKEIKLSKDIMNALLSNNPAQLEPLKTNPEFIDNMRLYKSAFMVIVNKYGDKVTNTDQLKNDDLNFTAFENVDGKNVEYTAITTLH